MKLIQLFESNENAYDFNFITECVIHYLTDYFSSYIIEHYPIEKEDIFDYFPLVYLKEINYEVNFSSNLHKFLKSKVKIELLPDNNDNNGTNRGFYSIRKNTIYVAIHESDINTLLHGVTKINIRSKIYSLLCSKKYTILHELIHAYDNYISSGKFVTNITDRKLAKAKNNQKLTPTERNTKNIEKFYKTSPSENSAKFYQVVGELTDYGYFNSSLSVCIEEFKKRFFGFDIQKFSVKNRLLSRLVQYYNYVKQQNELDDNVSDE